MKYMKKLTAAIIILFSCAAFFACSKAGQTDKPGSTEISGNPGGDVSDEDEAKPQRLQPNLPDMDLNGETINFLVRGEQYNWYWCSREIYAGEENGEPLNDAVYRRNRHVEGKYNFEIKEYRSSNPYGDADKAAKAGDPIYDAFMLGPDEAARMAQNGYLQDLHKIPHLDLSRPWWDQRAVGQLNIGGRLYCAFGDINTQDNDALFVVFFNKKLIVDHNMDNPYPLVRNGEWTLDKFNQMCRDISKDTNGDGKMDENDLYGQLTEYLGAYMFFVGGGGRITSNNAENSPELVISGEKTTALVDKMLVSMGNREFTLMANDYFGKYKNPWDDLTRPMFKGNQALFYTIGMGTADLMRDMEADFGVLPLPKFDANQKEYYCPGSNMISALCIPVTNGRTEYTGLAVEAMAAESMYTVTEAYYSINFENKNLRDEESIDMMKIILASGSYDLGYMFNFGGLVDIFEPMAKKNSNTFVSDYEKKESKAQKDIEKFTEKFQGMQ